MLFMLMGTRDDDEHGHDDDDDNEDHLHLLTTSSTCDLNITTRIITIFICFTNPYPRAHTAKQVSVEVQVDVVLG